MTAEAAVLGTLDVFSALALVWANQKITSHASLKSCSGRWALARRAIYSVTSIALFGLGIGRLSGIYRGAGIWWSACQSIILLYVICFPMLRAMGFISQDHFIAERFAAKLPRKRSRPRP